MTTTADVPDTERCHTWHANRYLAAHGFATLPACTCCTEPEEPDHD